MKKPSQQTSPYDRLLELICKASIRVTGVALVFMTFIFGWLVFGRYVLNSTPTWVEQVSLLLVSLIGFIGASVGVHQKTHLGVTFFRDMGPPIVKKTFEVTSHVLVAGFGAIMMVYSYDLVVFKWSTKIPLINLPEGLRAIPIMLCGAFTLLYSIGHLIRFFKDTKKPSNLVD